MIEMQAGRELDALIARRVFGEEVTATHYVEGGTGRKTVILSLGSLPLPHYSTDMGAAWQIAEHFQADGGEWDMEMSGNMYTFTLYRKHRSSVCGEAETAPLAICRAALAAVTP